MNPTNHFFFCGIGGTGMSALATVLRSRGICVSGSDRSFDQGKARETADILRSLGVTLAPQDGSGVDDTVTTVVVSTAVEADIPDVRAAREHDVPVIRRAELLHQIFSQGPAIAVGGTSGKTTVTAMTGHILREVGKCPTVVNGGIMLNSLPDDGLGNAWAGDPALCVIEADESDGTIELYEPQVAVVTTISLDHQPMPELRRLFGDFVDRAATAAVINVDCAEVEQLAGRHPNTITIGIDNPNARLRATDLVPRPDGISFKLESISPEPTGPITVNLAVPGRHNVINALIAIASCAVHGVTRTEAAAAMATFRGTHRRHEVVGTSNGVTVIDDFAHNPEKIAASLQTLTEFDGRIIVFFQPHGYGPTRLLRDGLIETFAKGLRPDDVLLMPEIYYAGGTAIKDISSKDLTDQIGTNAEFIETRDRARARIVKLAQPGDRVIIMGARDSSLATFARELVDLI